MACAPFRPEVSAFIHLSVFRHALSEDWHDPLIETRLAVPDGNLLTHSVEVWEDAAPPSGRI
jgi:hypothetical protein